MIVILASAIYPFLIAGLIFKDSQKIKIEKDMQKIRPGNQFSPYCLNE